jgi:hypothetical protein
VAAGSLVLAAVLGAARGMRAEAADAGQRWPERDAGAPQLPPGALAPDPPAITSADQYVVGLRYEAGKVTFAGARRVRLGHPRTTPRNTGRFALELLSGPTLVERLRFDFPLLGADELAGKGRVYNSPPRFERKAVIAYSVLVPSSSRFSQARLVDRATGHVLKLPWPPDAPPAASPADAGTGPPGSAPSSPPAASAHPPAPPDAGASTRDAR